MQESLSGDELERRERYKYNAENNRCDKDAFLKSPAGLVEPSRLAAENSGEAA